MSSEEKRNSSRGMKGQMFLIGSIILVVALILIKTSINVDEVLEKKMFLESGLEKTEFANLRLEVPKSAYNSLNNTQNMTNITNAFIAFAENKLAGRTVRLDGVSINSAYGNLTASTSVPLNVTFFNFFDVDITAVVMNFSSNFSNPISLGLIPAGSSKFQNFTINTASSQNMTLWVLYQTSTESVVQNITIPADVGQKTKFVGYFDMRMTGERGTIRDRFNETVDIN